MCVIVCVCKGEGVYVFVRESERKSERTHTSVSPGDVAKNKQLLKPSGV